MLTVTVVAGIAALLFIARRSYWVVQILRASSRLLNALTGGEGDSTFSAWSWHLAIQPGLAGKIGRLRVAVVDRFAGAGHCEAAYAWHAQRDLLARDATT